MVSFKIYFLWKFSFKIATEATILFGIKKEAVQQRLLYEKPLFSRTKSYNLVWLVCTDYKINKNKSQTEQNFPPLFRLVRKFPTHKPEQATKNV